MLELLPRFRRFQNHNGACTLRLDYTAEAKAWITSYKAASGQPAVPQCRPPDGVLRVAREAVQRLQGDVKNELNVPGQCHVQYGKFRGMTS